MKLRDHSRPCEDEPGAVLHRFEQTDPYWLCAIVGCPGGAEVEIDYGAGFDAAISRLQSLAPSVLHVAWHEAVKTIVDAALGIGENE